MDRAQGFRRRTPAGSVCPGVGGGGRRLASWASLAFSHHGSRSLCPHASPRPGESHYHPLLPYINTSGLQTNPHCSEISRRGRTAPLGEQNEAKRMGGREGGGGRADPVSRCRFPLKITKRDLFFRTASGWERTLTTQNSFTNGLVLSFSSLGPQISLPDPSAYSVLAGNGVRHRAGGRQLPCCRLGSKPGSQGPWG